MFEKQLKEEENGKKGRDKKKWEWEIIQMSRADPDAFRIRIVIVFLDRLECDIKNTIIAY